MKDVKNNSVKADFSRSASPKNINHWIAELRKIAYKADLREDDNETPLTMESRKELFNKSNFSERFKEGLTPQEAFETEMECWMDAQHCS